MSKKEENAVTRFVLRLPTQLCNQVKKRAKVNNRSMNSEIINILKAWNE